MDRPMWPMIVMRTPKGWTCPKEIDGKQTEGSWRAHQVPLASARDTDAHLHGARGLDEVVPPRGAVRRGRRAAHGGHDARPRGRPAHERGAPGERRPAACRTCACPTSATTRVDVPAPGAARPRPPACSARWLEDVMRANPDNFRIFAPDELASNRLQAVLEVTDKVWQARREDDGTHTGPEGRVIEMLSEHQCQGWLEGYLLTGRHGLFTSYEAFIHIIDSMFNQHAKWLKVSRRAAVASPGGVAQLPALQPRVAPGPQRLLATRIPASSTTWSTRRPRWSGCTCRRTPTRCSVDLRPQPAPPRLRQRGGGRQAAAGVVADDGPGDRPLHARPRHLGVRLQRAARARSPTW